MQISARKGKGCSAKRFFDENTTGGVYHKLLLLGGLKVGSLVLNNYVPLGFAVLDAREATIRKFNVPTRNMGEHLQRKVLSNNEYGFTCSTHGASIYAKTIRVMVNLFFNNQRKYSTDSVFNDQVVLFKKLKCPKSSIG